MYKNFAKIYDLFMEICNYSDWNNQVYTLAEKYNKKSGTLLDIGCGTGEVILRALDRYRCTGIDISPEMLRIAEKKLKNKNVLLFQGDMAYFNLQNKFDVCISLFDTVNHLLTLEDLVDHFHCVREHLVDDGIYIFDVVDRNFMDEIKIYTTYFDENSKTYYVTEI